MLSFLSSFENYNTTTFAILAVFMPVSFMPGIPGQFFKEFGVT